MEEIKNDVEEKNEEKKVVQTLEKEETQGEAENITETENDKEEFQEKEKLIEVENEEGKDSKIGIILIITAIAVVLITLASTLFAAINIKNVKILKGVTVGNIDVSDLTKEDAVKKIEEVYDAKGDKQIYFKYGEYETSVTYEALEVKYQIENAVEQAYEIGRAGNIFQDNFEILNTWRKSKNVKLEVTIDNDMIDQIAQNINNSIDNAVVQPSYYIEKDKSQLVITSGKEGVKVDQKQLIEEIYKVLDENK